MDVGRGLTTTFPERAGGDVVGGSPLRDPQPPPSDVGRNVGRPRPPTSLGVFNNSVLMAWVSSLESLFTDDLPIEDQTI